MYEISKTFSFEAAHSLPHLPDGHKCQRVHGHSYRVEIVCRGELDERGFVIDYAEISEAIDPVIKRIDHHFLNDVMPYPTTAENLARWIYEQCMGEIPIWQVHVFETAKTRCTFPAR